MVDLILGYNVANAPPLLKFLLSNVDELKFQVAKSSDRSGAITSKPASNARLAQPLKRPVGRCRPLFAGLPQHEVATLVGREVFGIALGYEDLKP
jgi:hypothetical protein